MSKHAIGKKFHSQNKFIDTALFPEAQRNGTKKLYYSPPLPCPAALQSIFTREYRGSTHRARVEVNFQKKLRNNIFSSRTKKKPRYFVRYRGHNPYQDFKLFHFRTGSDSSVAGEMTIKRPSASSAERIIPCDSIPFNLRGSRLATKHTFLPTKSSGA